MKQLSGNQSSQLISRKFIREKSTLDFILMFLSLSIDIALSFHYLNIAKNMEFSFWKTSTEGGENKHLFLYAFEISKRNTNNRNFYNEKRENMKGLWMDGWMDMEGCERKYGRTYST